MADGSVVFATELDKSGLQNALTKIGDDKAFLNKLDKIGLGIGSALGTAIKAGVAAVGAVGTGAVTILTKSLGAMKELEQNLGGSEAVFADYAKTIQTTGVKAFKKLGLSQSDYLATANKMGSLFLGSGFDLQKASELTIETMQRAADGINYLSDNDCRA